MQIIISMGAGPSGRPKQFPSQKFPLGHAERQRFRNIARRAAETLFECEQAGNQAADQRLIDFADSLQEAAAYYNQVREGKK